MSRDFAEFVQQLRQQALSKGISATVLDQQLPQLKLFRKGEMQAQAPSLEEYIASALNAPRLLRAKQLYLQHQPVFVALSAKFQVPPRFVLAWWAMASDFGQQPGSYPLLSVVASKAFFAEDPKALTEVIEALALASPPLSFDRLLSNSDGRLGQAGLTVADYRRCAADGDGDGFVDVWQSIPDVYASIASCLHFHGWDASQTWGRQVRVDESIELRDAAQLYTFAQWQALGVRRYDGGALPIRSDMLSSLLVPAGKDGRYYLIYDNYRVLQCLLQDERLTLVTVLLSEKIRQLSASAQSPQR